MKKIQTLLVAFICIISFSVPVSAQEVEKEIEKPKVKFQEECLKEIKILQTISTASDTRSSSKNSSSSMSLIGHASIDDFLYVFNIYVGADASVSLDLQELQTDVGTVMKDLNADGIVDIAYTESKEGKIFNYMHNDPKGLECENVGLERQVVWQEEYLKRLKILRKNFESL